MCSTHSKCWFGLLSCGEVKETAILKRYIVKNRERLNMKMTMTMQQEQQAIFEPQPYVFINNIPAFLGWSLRALMSQTRVNGREVITPHMKLLTTSLSSGKKQDVVETLIGEYVTTIPGSSRIETHILSLYPGWLFNFSAQEKQEGRDLLHVEHLAATSEPSSPADVAPAASMEVRVSYAGKQCSASFSARSAALPRPQPLPYCTGGANAGRWIRLPASIADGECNVSSLRNVVAEIVKVHKKGDVEEYRKRAHVHKAFMAETYHKLGSVSNYTAMWKSVTQFSGEWDPDYQVYMTEFARYANGAVCTLAFLESSILLDNDRLLLFAPYACRYRIFGSAEAQQCLIRNHTSHPLIFHGDSVNAQLLHEAQLLLNMPAMSTTERKEATHVQLKSGNNVS